MHDKEEDDSLKDCFACVAKHKHDEKQLWWEKQYQVYGSNTKHQQPYDDHSHEHESIDEAMKLVYCCFCITQWQGQRSSLFVHIHL